MKTRLAATVGDDSALEIYTAMFQHILGNIHEAPCEILLCVEGDEGALPSTTYHRYAQRGDGLGERIVNAIVDAGAFDCCVVIGTDAPFLDAHVIGNSFTQLESSDVVIGPSLDGGYYLIGFNVMNTTLFDRISWSSEHVLLQTIERCNELDLKLELLPSMIDVDTVGDVLMLETEEERHTSIVQRLRSIITVLLVVVLCSAPCLPMADGSGNRERSLVRCRTRCFQQQAPTILKV
ncbi:MAG: TIGR04282 family arsenosugar biosynthesis glycosyltransferase [Ignavibacteria bacterium]|nr:TIGR04282 family arsenosugar biosynthesis glycosyltransferase [Ignavibacteria bacterium]